MSVRRLLPFKIRLSTTLFHTAHAAGQQTVAPANMPAVILIMPPLIAVSATGISPSCDRKSKIRTAQLIAKARAPSRTVISMAPISGPTRQTSPMPPRSAMSSILPCATTRWDVITPGLSRTMSSAARQTCLGIRTLRQSCTILSTATYFYRIMLEPDSVCTAAARLESHLAITQTTQPT